MATFRIVSMGKQQGERIMARIIDEVSRTGRFQLEAKNNHSAGFDDLMANNLCQYKVLTKEFVQGNPGQPNLIVYSEGENFAAAKQIGAPKFIRRENKRLNPNWFRRQWMLLDKSNIISGVIGAIVGALIGAGLSC